MASYLGRNVNLALLIIIIGVIVALVGTTVFFQKSLQNRTTSYEDTKGTLTECKVALANYQDKYSESQAQVTETAEDIRKYDQLYEQKVGELDDTQGQLLSVQKQFEFEKIQREDFQNKYESALTSNQQLLVDIDDLEDDKVALNARINNLEEDLDACTG